MNYEVLRLKRGRINQGLNLATNRALFQPFIKSLPILEDLRRCVMEYWEPCVCTLAAVPEVHFGNCFRCAINREECTFCRESDVTSPSHLHLSRKRKKHLNTCCYRYTD